MTASKPKHLLLRPGRKPLSDDTVRMQVKVPRDDHERYRALAQPEDLSTVVRRLLERWARRAARD